MTTYRERLVPGIGTCLAVCLLIPASLLVFLPISVPVGIASAILLTGGALTALVYSSPVLEVRDGRLFAGRARISVGLTGHPEALRADGATAARGVGLDARAWTLLRGWVDPVVRIPIEDADDPVPYWVVSTRHPDELVVALESARATTV